MDWDNIKLFTCNYYVGVDAPNKSLKVVKCRGSLPELLDSLWVYFPEYTIEAFGVVYARERRH